MNKVKIYLDDIRTPNDKDWLVVRSFYEFVDLINKVGLNNIELISLDHDLGDTAMNEYYNNVSPNYKLDYENIEEKTGYDAVKWLVNLFYSLNEHRINMSRSEKKRDKNFYFPKVVVHSANPIGSANIMGYINNFLMNEGKSQDCIRVKIEYYV
jgi:hypothetical protein